jgi:enoyl-CoA hydratase/carnithine racemase
MAYERIIYEKVDRIAYITLNRPEALNAIDATMRGELREALSDFDLDPEVWLAIVSGNGRCFSAGADVNRHANPQGLQTTRPDWYLLDYPVNWKPVIAAVHGYTYGAALSFVAECDLVVASRDAGFGLIETKRGMPAISIFAQLLPWMGSKQITEMLLTGDPLSAEDAHRLGLVNRLVPTRDDLLPAAEELAQRVLANPPLVVRAGVEATRTTVMKSETLKEAELLFRKSTWRDWEDHKESVRAFLEKRPPVFTGR